MSFLRPWMALVLLAAIGLTGVGALGWWLVFGPPVAPMLDYGACVQSHTRLAYGPTFGYKGKMHMAWHLENVCDQRQYPDGLSPDYRQAFKVYQTKLAAYQRAHPH